MRYQTSPDEKVWVLGELPTGGTVTIALYNLEDSSAVTLSSSSCTEISTTGVYKWSSEQITTQPTTMTQYLYIMTDATNNFLGKLVLGGFPDEMSFQRRFDKNKHTLEKISENEYRHKLYADNGSTVLIEWKVTKEDSTETREEV